MRVLWEIILVSAIVSVVAIGCRSAAPSESSPHPYASEAEIRANIVGTWGLVEPTNEPPVRITFSSDGTFSCAPTRPGFPIACARWTAREGFVCLVGSNSPLDMQGWFWHVFRVDRQELDVFTGGFSAVGPTERFKRSED
jgi:hypothetical protein